MIDVDTSLTTLGVIPVLVNTGAALIPAAIAAVASAIGLLFKPRELARVCRQKPQVPILLLVFGLGIYGLIRFWPAKAEPASGRAARSSAAPGASGEAIRTDWTQIALRILQDERRMAEGTAEAPSGKAETSEPVETGDAAIFRWNNARTGYAGGGAPVDLGMLWEYHPEDDAMILASPLERDGTVYAASTLLDPPNNYGTVFAIDAETGAERWKTMSLPGGRDMKGFFSSPALTADGSRLLIGQGLHPDTECELICLDTATGEVVWTVRTPIHVESSPAIEGDIVVVGAGAIEKGPERKPSGDPEGAGHPGYVFAVRISTGEEIWRYQVNDPESSPAIRDGVVYIGSGFQGNQVVALRLEGTDAELEAQGLERLVWRAPTPYPALGAVTVDGDLVLIGGGNSDFVFADPNPAGVILAFDRKTGGERWRLDLPDSVLGPIAARDGVGYAPVRSADVEGRRRGQVVAFGLESGKILWTHSLERNALMLAGATPTPDHVYTVSADGYLRLLDRGDGSLVEEVYLNRADRPGEQGLSMSSPLVIHGRLYVGSETGGLRAYRGGVEP